MPIRSRIVSNMNRLSQAERAQVFGAWSKATRSEQYLPHDWAFARNTITTLLVALVPRLLRLSGPRTLRNLGSRAHIECDETWAFCHAKARNVPEEHRDEFGWGDVWTWVALDPDTKLVVTWLVGRAGMRMTATAFLARLGGPTWLPRPVDNGRPPSLPRGCRGSLWRRYRLRHAHQVLRHGPKRGSQVQPASSSLRGSTDRAR